MINKELYKEILEHAPYRVALVNKEGFFKYINRVEKYPIEEVLKMGVFQFVPKALHAELKKNLNTVFEEGISSEYEMPGESAYDKGLAWYKIKISPILNNNNSAELAVVNFEDITIAKQKDEFVQAKQAQLYSIINNTDDIILSVDKELRVVEFNNAISNLYKKAFNKDLTAGVLVFDLFYFSPDKKKLAEIYARVLNGERILMEDKFPMKNGNFIHFETSYNPIITNGIITGVALFSRNITKRKIDEEKLHQTLQEKETLLAEIHHRVKNNLAIISSILQLQELNLNDSSLKTILTNAQGRIKSTALVHEMLYENDSLSNIRFDDYIKKLSNHLNAAYNSLDNKINYVLNLEPVKLNITQAIPCGLFLNELLTNAYKHAFTNSGGNIYVNLSRNDKKEITIEVGDNGKGLPSHFDLNNSNSTGMTLVQTFAKQLNGKLSIVSTNPTKFSLIFNAEN